MNTRSKDVIGAFFERWSKHVPKADRKAFMGHIVELALACMESAGEELTEKIKSEMSRPEKR